MMFKFVSQSEDETFEETQPLQHIHLVTTNAFDIARAFRYRTDALFYAYDFISAVGAAPALKYAVYRQSYVGGGMVLMQSSDVNCNLVVTVRKTDIRREKCYATISES
jgi:hypothetical protein